jgi:hypothetical protein
MLLISSLIRVKVGKMEDVVILEVKEIRYTMVTYF